MARNLRNESTLGEVILWNEVLKDKMFYGYQFNRQFALGHFIVDFICRKLKLVVEVDGRSHQFKIEEDTQRDEELQKLGFQVLRVSEWEVKHDLPNVVRAMESFLPDDNEC